MSGECGEEEVPSWISQLNALTAASLRSPNPTKGADGKEAVSKSLGRYTHHLVAEGGEVYKDLGRLQGTPCG